MKEKDCGKTEYYQRRHIWEAYGRQLLVDYQQLWEEGTDAAPYLKLCEAVDVMP